MLSSNTLKKYQKNVRWLRTFAHGTRSKKVQHMLITFFERTFKKLCSPDYKSGGHINTLANFKGKCAQKRKYFFKT